MHSEEGIKKGMFLADMERGDLRVMNPITKYVQIVHRVNPVYYFDLSLILFQRFPDHRFFPHECTFDLDVRFIYLDISHILKLERVMTYFSLYHSILNVL